jgi:serine/threonine protein kinase
LIGLDTAERLMPEQDPESPSAGEPVSDGAGAVNHAPEGPVDAQEEELSKLLAQWEERCQRVEDEELESLVLDDPSLVRALRERINRRKQNHSPSQSPTAASAEDSRALDEGSPAGADATETSPLRPDDRPRLANTRSHSARRLIGRYRVIRVIGAGGFGQVFLAHDEDLDRDIAIKVPVERVPAPPVDVESYLDEARILARLSHPNIVPVYDVGRTENGRWYVVSKYMGGGDLAGWMSRGRATWATSVDLVRQIAEALHYTHTKDLFHRDIKPANILLDESGVPYLSDFGLALKDENVGQGIALVGTASYMSPEQARGEGHLVDGRSDIFSLGIVLYELLTGRRPFRGSSREAVMKQIVDSEPRPPRQIDDSIPRELERICMKAISKRASERYTTARDFADDLRHFANTTAAATLGETHLAAPAATSPSYVSEPATSPSSQQSDSSVRTIRIVPKGLGSFDENDADFFVELLPGPRDRGGLPDGLRFWKARIEAADPDKTFRVGMIYGPSGCGKSSLVKAGLLPLLGRHVISVYVEAAAGQTEVRLLRGIRKQFPGLPADTGLIESLIMLRRGLGLPAGCKALVVLDQFEQWLFAREGETSGELVAALRQCDGEHVQALCLLRDDFWMAATRFMKELEIDLVPDRNVAVVDLFDANHARKVLAAYGRAYEVLPARGSLSREQQLFLDRAIAGLAQDGRVVPVRLALFAEMIKGKPWTPTTLRDVGGMDGVGVKFLEDTFSSARSHPNHRYHQKAAQAVLKALLPETDTDIKGRMRALEELRAVSGYADRPDDFAELVRILDNDLRLVTPFEPVGSSDEASPSQPAAGRYYQLTHDYLVHALRDWLSRKQRETHRGRSELRLAAITSSWRTRPGTRQLPSPLEWLDIICFTKARSWSGAERQMMRAATRHYAVRALGALLVLAIISIAILEYRRGVRTSGLISNLLVADTGQVLPILNELDGERGRTARDLERIATDSARPPKERLHASLALLPWSEAHDEYLFDQLLVSEPDELIVITERLRTRKAAFLGRLWAEATSAGTDRKRKLRAACTLAALDPGDSRWAELAPAVARLLVLDENSFHLDRWLHALQPVRKALVEPLGSIFRDRTRGEDERFNAAVVLRQFAADDARVVVKLIQDADLRQYSILMPLLRPPNSEVIELLAENLEQHPATGASDEARNELASQQANSAVTLLLLGHPRPVWPLLSHSPEPRARGYLLDRIEPRGVDARMLVARLREEKDTSARRALILVLADIRGTGLPADERAGLVRELRDSFGNDPDPGVHSAAELLLRRYGQDQHHDSLVERSNAVKPGASGRWSINHEGHTMVVIDPRGMDPVLSDGRAINRVFAMASKEVSVEQFLRFRPHPDYSRDHSPTPECPINGVTWYDAAAYCRWLSEQEGVLEKDMCYPPIAEIKEGMRLPADYLKRTGYRLPTEAEAEFACRAGAVTSRFFGSADELLPRYAYFRGNGQNHAWPVGSLWPNDLGLFDTLGNVMEWCQESRSPTPRPADNEDTDAVSNRIERVLHSGSYEKIADHVRSDRSEHAVPSVQFNSIGFRVARTQPPRP